MKLIRFVIHNPLALITPLLVVMIIGWYQFAAASKEENPMPGSIMPNGDFSKVDSRGVPQGWRVEGAASINAKMVRSGYVDDRALLIASDDSHEGVVTLASPVVAIKPSKTYLYKSFYKSTAPVELVMVTKTSAGETMRQVVASAGPTDKWLALSYAFESEPTVNSAQFYLRLDGPGQLQVDGAYLQPNPTNVYIKPVIVGNENIIPNPSLGSNGDAGAVPDSWTGYEYGSNTASFVKKNDDGVYLRAKLSDYRDGEAKWQYAPVDIKPGARLQFAFDYRCDQAADVVAEYVTDSDQRHFVSLDTLQPEKDWINYSREFEAPPNAKSVVVTAVARGDGTLDTRDYHLSDISKPGDTYWPNPMVTLTFDDGWESAYTHAAPMLGQYGYKATFYINPSSLNTTSFMSSKQTKQLSDDGHELASHAYEHVDLRAMNAASVDYQMRYASDYFSQVLGQKSVNFATPFGGSDAEVQFYARKYYKSMRSTGDGINTKQGFDPYDMKVLYVSDDTPIQKVQDALVQTRATNGWLVLVYHRIEPVVSGKSVTSVRQFGRQLDVIKRSGISVKTVDQGLKAVSRSP